MPQQGVHVVWKGHPCGLLRDICSQVLPGRDDIPAAHGVGAMKGGARGVSFQPDSICLLCYPEAKECGIFSSVYCLHAVKG